MTAAMLIKNGGCFINLGHWGQGGVSGVAATELAGQGDTGAAAVVLIAQVIWAIVGVYYQSEVNVKRPLIITRKVTRSWSWPLKCLTEYREETRRDNEVNNHVFTAMLWLEKLIAFLIWFHFFFKKKRKKEVKHTSAHAHKGCWIPLWRINYSNGFLCFPCIYTAIRTDSIIVGREGLEACRLTRNFGFFP